MKINSKLISKKKKIHIFSQFWIFFVSSISVIMLFLMIGFILKESIPAYKHYGFFQIYFTADTTASGNWGIWGGLFITLITSIFSVMIATPIALRSAIFIYFRLNKFWKKTLGIIINILAATPSVIFGVFAINSFGNFSKIFLGFNSSLTIINSILILVIMIFPILVSLILNQIKVSDKTLLNSSISLGNTKTYSIYKILKKSIRAGIYIAVITALGRAIGETMALSMILTNSPSASPFGGGLKTFLSQGYATLGVVIARNFFTDSSDPNIRSALFAFGIALFFIIMFLVILITNLSKKKRFHNNKFHLKPQIYLNQNIIFKICYVFWHFFKLPFKIIKYFFIWFLFKLNELWYIVKYYLFYPFFYFLLPYKKNTKSYSEYFVLFNTSIFFKVRDIFVVILEFICTFIIIGSTFWILFDIFYNGLPEWSVQKWNFTNLVAKQTDATSTTIVPGVIGNTLVFTILLVFLTISLSLPLSFITAIYLSEYARNNRAGKMIRFFLDSLGGTPSILFGIFGVIFFRQFLEINNGNFSVLAAALTMILVVIPTFTRSIEQVMVKIPNNIRYASYALGASKLETIKRIILPRSVSGIITGIVLSSGRVIAETAPVYLLIGVFGSIHLDILDQGWTLTTKILYNQIWETKNNVIINTAESYAIASVAILLILILIFTIELIKPTSQLVRKIYKYIKIARNKKRLIINLQKNKLINNSQRIKNE